MQTCISLSATTLLLWFAFASATYSTTWNIVPNVLPQSVPLAVKSPYVNAWAPQAYGSAAVSEARPRFWASINEIIEWYASMLVDGSPYLLVGDAAQSGPSNITTANQTQLTYTASQTSYLLTAGPIDVNLTFLSPVEASNLTRLSTPFSYLQISVEANDGNPHDVQIYSDVYGQWICDDNYTPLNWTATTENDVTYLQMEYVEPIPFTESADRPRDGVMYYAAKNTSGLSWQIGLGQELRTSFYEGTEQLSNSMDGNSSRTVGSSTAATVVNNEALAFVYDLGKINTSQTVSLAIGVVRDPAIQYVDGSGKTENRSSFYWSQYSSISSLISDVINGIDDAMSASNAFDAQVASAAASISSLYGPLVYLSVRQVFSSLEYTVGRDSSGNFNTSDIKVFMKNLGGIGKGGINAVDALYASMPFYIYLAPDILGYLLEPLLDAQENSVYTQSYAAVDLGSSFPKATGNSSAHNEGIEQSANMIIMALAQAQTSGNASLLSRHFGLLDRWGQYLVANCLSPDDQRTSASDGISTVNQTNLALKGIIAVSAMSKISAAVGSLNAAQKYNDTAQNFFQQWKLLALASWGISLGYGTSSSGLIYNLYADKLLQLGLVDDSTYSLQTSVYGAQLSQEYGIAMDLSSQNGISRADWMLFAAAAVTDSSIQQSMIEQIVNYISAGTITEYYSNLPFVPEYSLNDASEIVGYASPAIGAMFSILALLVDLKSLPSSPEESRSKTLIVGVVVGCLAGVALLAIGAYFYWRRRRFLRNGIVEIKPLKGRASMESKSDASLLPTVNFTPRLDKNVNAKVIPNTDSFPAAGTKAAEALMESRNQLMQQYREALDFIGQSQRESARIQRSAVIEPDRLQSSPERVPPDSMTSMACATTANPPYLPPVVAPFPSIATSSFRRRPPPGQHSDVVANANLNNDAVMAFVLSPTEHAVSEVPFSLTHSEIDSNPLPVPTTAGFTGSVLPLSMTSLLNEARQNTQQSQLELQEEVVRLRHAIDAMMTQTRIEALEARTRNGTPEYMGALRYSMSDSKCDDTQPP